ncbi:ABC transporter substrate-binding protein [Goodfellowiella coeruleoviolacea]|uniref:Branched-chain amino acid transport system substrate-binding protein n=1 Tax=Goodfellowiella coeruleoviolacea TaxID=334858 RepID=A0AAE3GJL7_9PSEU|nr:ABC transporter substrate-binding protein [Goodfellowiella coeruleoviolacea]MCP2167353.1 branched-chain amino acid transport system substrate-binding protein [Goodfellowiella coeruleoviolacea]
MRAVRRTLVAAVVGAVALSACGAVGAGAGAGDTVYFGVSGPVTGPSAEYGRLWKQGFDLALDKVNAEGGVNGKKVELKWEDSQSDPKQTVPIAQKFVNDPSIIAELGDFSSPASMAASPIYQQRGLVQYGFTNSHPDFTKGGDHVWSPSLTQEFFQRANARAVSGHARRVSVVYQQTDWGKTAFDIFSATARDLGLDIVYSSAFLPDSTDFRPILIQARDAAPDAVVHLGYGPDGALIVKQLRDIGFTGQFFGGQNTPEFLRLAGAAAEGDIITGYFVNSDPRPEVQSFVTAFRDRYHEDPGEFNVYAYDALITLVTAARNGGATREGVLKGLRETPQFPSVQFGSLSFNDERRPHDVQAKELVVRDGVFVLNQS